MDEGGLRDYLSLGSSLPAPPFMLPGSYVVLRDPFSQKSEQEPSTVSRVGFSSPTQLSVSQTPASCCLLIEEQEASMPLSNTDLTEPTWGEDGHKISFREGYHPGMQTSALMPRSVF